MKKDFIPTALAEEVCDASPTGSVSVCTYFTKFMTNCLIENM